MTLLRSPSSPRDDPHQPVETGQGDECEDHVVEGIPDALEHDIEDVHVGDEVAPGESSEEQEEERDPVQRILWPQGSLPSGRVYVRVQGSYAHGQSRSDRLHL